MRLTFIVDVADMSGGTRVVATYADRLRRLGHQVTVISRPRRRYTLRERTRSLIRGCGWPAQGPRLWPSYFDTMEVDHRILDMSRPVEDADVPDADVVIATWWETAEWVGALSARKGAKAYLIQHHEVLFDSQPSARVAETWRLPLHKIVISRWLQEVAQQEYGITDVSLVPNSVDTNQFNAPPRGRQRRPTVGMLYNTNSRFKGCEVSIEAIRRLLVDIPDVQVVSFGNQPVSPQLPLPPDARHIESPPQDQIKQIYAQCDAWLCASHSEGFGLTTLEAMACRCPAVSTRVGGAMDFINEGVSGYVVDVGDVAALTDRLRKVLQSPEARWRAMSDAALKCATRYSWDDATMLLERALRETIEPKERPAERLAPAIASAH